MVATSPLQNPFLHGDVNGDGDVTPLDALLILNRIAMAHRQGLDGNALFEALIGQGVQRYYDVRGTGSVEPLDALVVLNHIARQRRQADGEVDASLGAPLLTAGPHVETADWRDETDGPQQSRGVDQRALLLADFSVPWDRAVDRVLDLLDWDEEEAAATALPGPGDRGLLDDLRAAWAATPW